MSKDTNNRVIVGDSLSTTHLTKNLGSGWVEKGLTTEHLTSQLKVPTPQTTTQSPTSGQQNSSSDKK